MLAVTLGREALRTAGEGPMGHARVALARSRRSACMPYISGAHIQASRPLRTPAPLIYARERQPFRGARELGAQARVHVRRGTAGEARMGGASRHLDVAYLPAFRARRPSKLRLLTSGKRLIHVMQLQFGKQLAISEVAGRRHRLVGAARLRER